MGWSEFTAQSLFLMSSAQRQRLLSSKWQCLELTMSKCHDFKVETWVFTPANVNVTIYFALSSAHRLSLSLETIISLFPSALPRCAGSLDDLLHLVRPFIWHLMTERLYCLTGMTRMPKHAGERVWGEEHNNGIYNMERDKRICTDAGLNLSLNSTGPAPVSFSHPLTVGNCKSAPVFFYRSGCLIRSHAAIWGCYSFSFLHLFPVIVWMFIKRTQIACCFVNCIQRDAGNCALQK